LRRSKTALAFLAVLTAATLVWPVAGAFAGKNTIYVNQGIGTARLKMKDSTAAKRIGKVAKKVRDGDYEKVYWIWYFGKKSHGKYAVAMHVNDQHKVWAFWVYSTSYVTAKKIRVGSTEAALKKAYGKSLAKRGRTCYHLGGRTGTDFWMKSGKVSQICVMYY
jgi:hypothetical protein